MAHSQATRSSENSFNMYEAFLRDQTCLIAFQEAIISNKHLFIDKVGTCLRSSKEKNLLCQVVLDVNSGIGLLSMFAAKAGAKRVYAVEASAPICRLAEELVRLNRLEHCIQLINRPIEQIDAFNEQIDIIISNWMGKIIDYYVQEFFDTQVDCSRFLPVSSQSHRVSHLCS
jgi:type I protein arginine methyltransferase